MEFMNDLLEREAQSMKKFLQLISVSIVHNLFSLDEIYISIHLQNYFYIFLYNFLI